MNIVDKISESVPQINEKNQNYILGGILLLIFLVDYFLIMNPQLRTLRTINPKINILSEDLRTARDDMQRMGQYQKDAERFRGQVDELNNSLISKEDIPRVLDNISRTANKVGVKIDQIKPVRQSEQLVLENKEGKFYSLPIQVSAQGGYHHVGRFINKIETENAFLSVSELSFSARQDTTSNHLAKFTIKAVIFEKAQK